MSSARTEPSVCAVCITRDRPEMTLRAVRCFDSQTYQNKKLAVYGNYGEASIGVLRNRANAVNVADIIVHLDSDDYSHPNRIAEQVAFLQSSGCDAVGYREMLFWDSLKYPESFEMGRGGEAWLYRNTDPVYCLGTSLCYWRRVWEARPFPDKTTGEDFFWLQGVDGQPRLNSRGVSAQYQNIAKSSLEPRMIATIHGGNIASRIQPGTMEWTRVPGWDDACRKTLEAA